MKADWGIVLPPSFLVAATAGLAQAADDKPAKPVDDQYIDVSPVALPIVVDGQVRNYVFVTVPR